MGSNIVVSPPEDISNGTEPQQEERSRGRYRESYDRRGGGRYNRRYASPRYNQMADQSPNYTYQQQQPKMDQYPCRYANKLENS